MKKIAIIMLMSMPCSIMRAMEDHSSYIDSVILDPARRMTQSTDFPGYNIAWNIPGPITFDSYREKYEFWARLTVTKKGQTVNEVQLLEVPHYENRLDLGPDIDDAMDSLIKKTVEELEAKLKESSSQASVHSHQPPQTFKSDKFQEMQKRQVERERQGFNSKLGLPKSK